ncbi:hypothetical protein E2C01_072464 [Portunus trituberculatus]|uniref:Uncharacterized protein n=1 Tax=Portunus trituberculatus TaxID=210409 RepID=A0A5B7IB94_PORTR|nr:hypothetical protein [Portunus trituberculatus]
MIHVRLPGSVCKQVYDASVLARVETAATPVMVKGALVDPLRAVSRPIPAFLTPSRSSLGAGDCWAP